MKIKYGLVYCLTLLVFMSVIPSCADSLIPADTEEELKIEATISSSYASEYSTKVDYLVNGGKLEQKWEVGDLIFGFDTDSLFKLTFRVKSVTGNGIAIFENLSPKTPSDGSKVCMFYAPGYSESDLVAGTAVGGHITVDYSTQSFDAVSSVMVASAEVRNHLISLSFENQMSIVAINDPSFDYLSGPTLTNVTVSGNNIKNKAMLSFDREGKFSITPVSVSNSVEVPCEVAIPSGGFTDTTLYVALFPSETVSDVTVDLQTTEKTYSIVKSGKSFQKGKCYLISPSFGKVIPADALSGEFSVSATRKVYFSKGNLKYMTSTKKWSFFENQYDYDKGTYDDFLYKYDPTEGMISSFCWGYTEQSVKPSLPNWEYSDLSIANGQNLPANKDYGYVFGGVSSIWRTLSLDEWKYLLSRDGNGKARYAEVQFTSDRSEYGLVLMPDEWDGQPMLSNPIDLEKWKKLEFKGAVFLPGADYRDNNVLKRSDTNPYVCYWTSTSAGYSIAYALKMKGSFSEVSTLFSAVYGYLGYSVRLVTDVK